jgi:alkylation response protein AidB-like acyl-CoA dehydrogenase
MPFELTARSEPGGRLVALAETIADEIAPRAAAHDRDASFPFDSFAILKESGYFTARFPRPSAASASPRCTTSSSPRAGSRAATPR